MERGTCQEWLQRLDAMDPPAAAWRDPVFVQAVSWTMCSFLWRRLNQRLIDAGYAADLSPES
jgi:hypothetical protein